LSSEIAQILIDINAVHYYDTEPFRFTSGVLSPVYVDCRKLISFPQHRDIVVAAALDAIASLPDGLPDTIAGGETAGIPYAAFIADRLQLPMIYVRKKSKEFGRRFRIEGALEKGCRVLLVEDLIFDSQSKLSFAEAIREAGGIVDTTLVVFEYGQSNARSQLAAAGLKLVSLASWADLLDLTTHSGLFSESQAAVVRSFLANPAKWLGEVNLGTPPRGKHV